MFTASGGSERPIRPDSAPAAAASSWYRCCPLGGRLDASAADSTARHGTRSANDTQSVRGNGSLETIKRTLELLRDEVARRAPPRLGSGARPPPGDRTDLVLPLSELHDGFPIRSGGIRGDVRLMRLVGPVTFRAQAVVRRPERHPVTGLSSSHSS